MPLLSINQKTRVGVSVVFWSPELKDAIEDSRMGWINHDNNPRNEYATYGRYAGGVGKFWCPACRYPRLCQHLSS
eukprot:COSAG02_NODE_3068_length_7430_cov_2.999864_4_plen_75_part_00